MRPTTLLPLLLLGPLPASAEPLAVKTGHWAMTVTMHIDGPLLSPEIMAKLPQAARAPMEAAMARMQQPTTRTKCLTPEELAKGFDLNHTHGGNCRQTLLRQTSSEIEIDAVSTGGGSTTTEHGTITRTGSQTVDGHFDIQRVAAEGPKLMTMQISGKWLDATCTGKEDGD